MARKRERRIIDRPICIRHHDHTKRPTSERSSTCSKSGRKNEANEVDFLQRCAEEDPGDPRLQTAVIPAVFETHGAAGPMACRLFSLTRHQYGNVVLPCEDRSSEQVFYAAWVHRISTAVQRGTALMIHNIAQGNRTKSRRTKDVDVEPAAGAGDGDDNQSASPDTGGYGESNSEIEFSEDDDDTPGVGVEGDSRRKSVPSKFIIKAARARRARRGR